MDASSTLAGALASVTTASPTTTTTTSDNNFYTNPNLLAAMQLNNLTLISEEEELKLLNFPSKREDLTTAIPLTVIFALLLVTGCIGNLCTAIVIARPKNKYMHTATNYYLFSLAMSDFLFLILGLPQEMYTLWQRYPYAFGESFCIIRGYLSEASTYASILTISAFTVERYVAICHPLWAHTMSQLPRAITSIVIIWMLAAICAIPPAAELGIITQRGPLTNRTLEQSAQCATKRTLYENMFVVSAIVFFIVPMIIVTVLYILIAFELRRSSKMNSAISKQTSSQQQQQQQQLRYLRNAQTSLSARQCCCQCAIQSYCNATGKLTRAPNSEPTSRLRPSRLLAVRGPFSWSRSQQHLSSGGRAGAPLEAAPSDTNLMANLMSQRPSSAMGATTFTCARSPGEPAAKQQQQFSFWPWSGQKQAPPSSPSVGALPLDPGEQAHEGARGAAPDSRGHSPLSYHESLIQRQQNSAAKCPHHQVSINISNSSNNNNSNHNKLLACQQQMSLTQSPSHQSLASTNSVYNQKQKLHQKQQQQQQNRRSRSAASSKKSVVRMLVAVVVSFFICWVPFHAQRLLASYLVKDENQNQVLLDIYLKLTYISGVMYYLSSTINPLLYQLMSAKFRLAFKETFNCSLFRCAIFGTATGHSPTNSLREHNTSNKHLRHTGTGNNITSSASRQPSEICSALYATAATNHNLSGQQQLQLQHQVLHCPCCPLMLGHDLHTHSYCLGGGQRAPPLGVIARLKGHLNSSLGSLLSRRDNSLDLARYDCGCPPPSLTYQATPEQRREQQQQHLGPDAQPAGGQLCSSTPLLSGSSQSAGGPTSEVAQVQTNKSASPTFQAHSMLKFIRSPTANSCLANQQPVSLTRLSSRDEEDLSAANSANDIQVLVVGCGQDERQTQQLERLIEPAPGGETGASVSPMASTSGESGHSTGSSPDQSATGGAAAKPAPASKHHRHQRNKACSAASSSSAGSGDKTPLDTNCNRIGTKTAGELGAGRRRRSLQQMHNLYRAVAGANESGGDASSAPGRDLADCSGAANSRRKSSTSSSARNQQLSSSLSSSERQLDKKLSLSTTTSALEDYGSYTTTNSALTGIGSNPNLGAGYEQRRRQSSLTSATGDEPALGSVAKRRPGAQQQQPQPRRKRSDATDELGAGAEDDPSAPLLEARQHNRGRASTGAQLTSGGSPDPFDG